MFTVHIRNNATGEIRQWVEQAEWGEGYEFMWRENNESCDCNRAIYFARAGNEDTTEAEKQECGNTAYSVLFVKLPDGQKIPIDD